jgi:hypothetical protein
MGAVVHNDLIDLNRYPLHNATDPRRKEAVAQARAALNHDGCAVVRDIVPPEAVSKLREEIVARLDTAHFSTQTINPSFHTERDASRPDRHPVNTFIERASGFIAGDAWSPNGPMRTLITSPELIRLIAECLEIDQLYPYADPETVVACEV